MENTLFLIVAVIIGSAVLGSVLWNFTRQQMTQSVILATTLSLIGFTLVSSPLWSSIAIKGPEWELSLLREQTETQLRNYVKLLEAYKKLIPPEKAELITPTIEELKSSMEELEAEKQDKEKIEKIKRVIEIASSTLNNVLPS